MINKTGQHLLEETHVNWLILKIPFQQGLQTPDLGSTIVSIHLHQLS